MSYIKGSWENTKIVCGNHEGPDYPPMILQAGKYSLRYVCSKCNILNTDEGELCCKNELSLADYENMLSAIAEFGDKSEQNGEVFHLEHYKWRHKSVTYEIIKHTPAETVVKVLDKISSAK